MFIPIEPLPCPRPRVTVRGRFAHAYYPASYKKWRAEFIKLLPPSVKLFATLSTGGVGVEIECVVTKARTSKLVIPKGDVDNYAKSVLDALTDAGAWKDDVLVNDLRVTKRFAKPGEQSGIRIDIATRS